PGWLQTTTNPADIAATSGQSVTVNFGNFQLVTISGQKFDDTNGNGAKDAGEPGLSGWTIFLDSNRNGLNDATELFAISDSPGTYRVREELQTGWTQTTTTPASIVVASGQNVSTLAFGNFQLVSLRGLKFEDINGNGIKDSGEVGVPNWTIFLDTNNNGRVDP